MRPIRLLLATLVMVLGVTGSKAQSFTYVIQGTLAQCAPGSTVIVLDLFSGATDTITVENDCTFGAEFTTQLPTGLWEFQTNCANGTNHTVTVAADLQVDSTTVEVSLTLACPENVVDCNGVLGGSALIGTPCDDGEDSTLLDSWQADCSCVGIDSSLIVLDCTGMPNGPNQPGTPCIVDPALPVLPIGIWSNDCQCIADSAFTFTDCLGVVNGSNLSGTPCDDGDENTTVDLWDASCQCVGYDSTQVTYDCLGIAFGNNLPGTPCITDPLLPVLPVGVWSADCVCIADTAVVTLFDCLGIPNGPNTPGSACDDGSTSTVNDIWYPGCFCAGTDTTTITDCLGEPNGPNNPGAPCYDPNSPFALGYWDLNCICVIDTMANPVDCLGIPGGPNMPGLPCSLLPDSSNTVVGIWGPDCICYANTFDCLGTPGGGALPGTPCTGIAQDGTIHVGIWGLDCFCYGDSINYVTDCLGQPNGPNLPGTPCIVDGYFPVLPIGIWSADCLCIADSASTYIDCLGIENGPNTIGSVCDTGNPNVLGYWNNACQCEAYTMPPCTAGFIVTPGIVDTTGSGPVQLWIWNSSYGGTGSYTYAWDFGDGSTSNDPWPTHDYEDFGPYLLCLTITDGAGCTSTYCDTLAVDENGLFRDRTAGFSVRVMAGEAPTGMDESTTRGSELSLWPNPASDRVSITFDKATSGAVSIRVIDVDGRVVAEEQRSIAGGNVRIDLATDSWPTGVYLVRIQSGEALLTGQLVKTAR